MVGSIYRIVNNSKLFYKMIEMFYKSLDLLTYYLHIFTAQGGIMLQLATSVS